MSDHNPPANPGIESHAGRAEFESAVRAQQARKRKAQREGDRSIWFGLGSFGVVGWSVAVPTLVGIAVGTWIDAKTEGQRSWTLMLMTAGIAMGSANAWTWIRRHSQDDSPQVEGDENHDE